MAACTQRAGTMLPVNSKVVIGSAVSVGVGGCGCAGSVGVGWAGRVEEIGAGSGGVGVMVTLSAGTSEVGGEGAGWGVEHAPRIERIPSRQRNERQDIVLMSSSG